MTTSYAAGFDSGIFDFQQKLARNGNAPAQYKLATMYESGRGIGKDINKAIEWYTRSAEQDNKAAINRLTYLEIKKQGFNNQHKAWLLSLDKEARSGDGEALLLMGIMLSEGIAVKKDLNNALAYLKKAKMKGITGAEEEIFSITNHLNNQKQIEDTKRQEQIKKQQETERLERQRAYKAERQQQETAARIKKQKAAEQKRQQQEQQRIKQQEERNRLKEQQKSETIEKPVEKFESNLCKGRSAKFVTACQ